jgi:hypothetical protein
LANYFLWYLPRSHRSLVTIVFIQLQKQRTRVQQQHAMRTVCVALFLASLLFAQLATIHHDVGHASHHHTHLCDAFTAYGHSKGSVTTTNPPDFSVQLPAVSYAFTTSAPPLAEPGNIRIRDPPSLRV